MDDIISQIILGLPNLTVALYVIWRDGQRIDKLLEQQRQLIEALLRMVEIQETRENGS